MIADQGWWQVRSRQILLDLFSATPPLEAVKLVISDCADGQCEGKPVRIGTLGVKRAYYYALVEREVFIALPPEDILEGDGNMVGRLRFSMYGTRDAAQNWARHYTNQLRDLGFQKVAVHRAISGTHDVTLNWPCMEMISLLWGQRKTFSGCKKRWQKHRSLG